MNFSNSKPKVLVTGSAGYIGSHVVQQLGESGHDIIVYDNCSTGFRDAVLCGELIIGDLSDTDRLHQVSAKHQFDAIIHFTASSIAPKSFTHPPNYYARNTRNTLNLLQCQCNES